MKNIPEKIYLQIVQDDLENIKDFKELYEVTWCVDKINDTDVEYVRKRSDERVINEIREILSKAIYDSTYCDLTKHYQRYINKIITKILE